MQHKETSRKSIGKLSDIVEMKKSYVLETI